MPRTRLFASGAAVSLAICASAVSAQTTSLIQDSSYFKEGAPIVLPTELWSFKPGR